MDRGAGHLQHEKPRDAVGLSTCQAGAPPCWSSALLGTIRIEFFAVAAVAYYGTMLEFLVLCCANSLGYKPRCGGVCREPVVAHGRAQAYTVDTSKLVG